MANQTDQHELVMNRLFLAPRDLVWKSWTEPEQIKVWSAPNNFSTPVYRIDLRVGGHYHNCMRSDDGTIEVWNTGTYLEIIPQEKIVMTDSFADSDGHVVRASFYGMGDEFPLESKVTLLFESAGENTQFTLVYEDVSTIPAEHLQGMTKGWNEMLDKLADYLDRGGQAQ